MLFFVSVFNKVSADDLRTPGRHITVVMDDNYPPYSYKDNQGKIQGITHEQWKLFEKKTGIKVDVTAMEWSKAIQAMQDGQFDVIDTISYNAERDKIYDFTQPYAIIDVLIYFNKNLSGITDIESLKGFTIGAKKSDNAIYELQQHGISNIKVYDSAEDVVKAAQAHEIELFAMGKPPSMYYLYKYDIAQQYHYANDPLYTSKFYRAVHEGDTALLDVLNQGFSSISTKEYRDIEEKWFGKSAPNTIDAQLIKNGLIAVVTAVVIVFLLLIWNRALQRSVRAKTAKLSESIDELRKSDARFRAIIEAIPDLFFLFDSAGTVIDYSISQKYKQLTIEEIPDEVFEQIKCMIQKSLESHQVETLELSFDFRGMLRHFETRFIECGHHIVVCVIRDITDSKNIFEKLTYISTHDTLTDVYNRYYFESKLVELNQQDNETQCLAIFDLDGLKLINDTMGHEIGDTYLKAAAQLIVQAFPQESVVCRVGGDEFSVILLNHASDDILDCIKNLKQSITLFNQKNERIQISITYGFSFSDENKDFYEMVREADNQMYRFKLHRRTSVKFEVVQMMKNMLEARDFITEGHVTRMEDLAVRLATAVNLPEKDIADIQLLAQFHDIGKVGIPDSILFKPSKLTQEEYEIMKRHTEIGHRIAEASNDLLPIADFILKHHEFWDGNGYPVGHKGEEIPIECRILSIVDAYDAMTNDRPYRKAMPRTDALMELKRCSGGQFDPVLVDVFIEIMSEQEGFLSA